MKIPRVFGCGMGTRFRRPYSSWIRRKGHFVMNFWRQKTNGKTHGFRTFSTSLLDPNISVTTNLVGSLSCFVIHSLTHFRTYPNQCTNAHTYDAEVVVQRSRYLLRILQVHSHHPPDIIYFFVWVVHCWAFLSHSSQLTASAERLPFFISILLRMRIAFCRRISTSMVSETRGVCACIGSPVVVEPLAVSELCGAINRDSDKFTFEVILWMNIVIYCI